MPLFSIDWPGAGGAFCTARILTGTAVKGRRVIVGSPSGRIRMLRIQRTVDGLVVLSLGGRIDQEHIAELETLIAAEAKGPPDYPRPKDVTLTGQDGIDFLAQWEAVVFRW